MPYRKSHILPFALLSILVVLVLFCWWSSLLSPNLKENMGEKKPPLPKVSKDKTPCFDEEKLGWDLFDDTTLLSKKEHRSHVLHPTSKCREEHKEASINESAKQKSNIKKPTQDEQTNRKLLSDQPSEDNTGEPCKTTPLASVPPNSNKEENEHHHTKQKSHVQKPTQDEQTNRKLLSDQPSEDNTGEPCKTTPLASLPPNSNKEETEHHHTKQKTSPPSQRANPSSTATTTDQSLNGKMDKPLEMQPNVAKKEHEPQVNTQHQATPNASKQHQDKETALDKLEQIIIRKLNKHAWEQGAFLHTYQPPEVDRRLYTEAMQ